MKLEFIENNLLSTSTPSNRALYKDPVCAALNSRQIKSRNEIMLRLYDELGEMPQENNSYDTTIVLDHNTSPSKRNRQPYLLLANQELFLQLEYEALKVAEDHVKIENTRKCSPTVPNTISCEANREEAEKVRDTFAEMGFEEWALQGLSINEREDELTRSLIMSRFRYLREFDRLSKLILEYGYALESTDKAFRTKVKELRQVNKEFLETVQ